MCGAFFKLKHLNSKLKLNPKMTNKMSFTKNIGIWMNHSIAYIMEFTAGLITTIKVESNPYEQGNCLGVTNNESLSFLKEQHNQAAYYKQLEESIKDCKEVILFGPTYAKVKLYHELRKDKRFAKTKIGVTQAENMTVVEQQEFVLNHFSKHHFFQVTSK